MADEATDATESGEEKKKSKLKLIIMILVAVLLLGGIGGAVWFFFFSGSDEQAQGDVTDMPVQDQVVTPASGMAIYLSLGPEFITSYATNGGRQRYLQTDLSVLARDQEAIDAVSGQLPLIRNNLLDLLALQDYEVLKTDEGREALANTLTEAVQEVLLEAIGRPGIERVLFRSFVLQ